MYQNIKLTCAAIALLIKPFVWWRCHCRRRRELLKFSLHLRPWQTRTHYCGHIVADTNVSPFTRARLCPGHKKMFLILFRRILCPLQMFPSLRSPRNIMGNNVSSFTRALSRNWVNFSGVSFSNRCCIWENCCGVHLTNFSLLSGAQLMIEKSNLVQWFPVISKNFVSTTSNFTRNFTPGKQFRKP